MSGMECTRLYDLAPELALGLLDGAERAEALAHLERCARCQADVASLTALGEQLLLVAPEVPPPAGFESRVLDQVEGLRLAAAPAEDTALARLATDKAGSVQPLRRRRQYRALVAAAAALVLVVGSAVVLIARSGDGDLETSAPTTQVPAVAASASMVNGSGRSIGRVDLLDTSPTTVQLDLADWMDAMADWSNPPHGPWTLAVFDAAGQQENYDLPLPADDPTPDVRLDEGDASAVHHVSVIDGDGHIWCTGRFA